MHEWTADFPNAPLELVTIPRVGDKLGLGALRKNKPFLIVPRAASSGFVFPSTPRPFRR